MTGTADENEGAATGGGDLGDSARDSARALLDVVQQWAQRTMPAPPSGHPGPECQWCPLCQLAAMLRGESPEIAERLTEAGGALVSAARALLDAAPARRHDPGVAPHARKPPPGHDTDPSDGDPAAGRPARPRPPTSRVQHIRLDGDPD